MKWLVIATIVPLLLLAACNVFFEPDKESKPGPAALDCPGPPTTYYRDSDEDGHGDPDASTELCGPEGSYTSLKSDDCDDTDETVHPDQDDICDGEDNDCDEDVDEGPAACSGEDELCRGGTCEQCSGEACGTVCCQVGQFCCNGTCGMMPC